MKSPATSALAPVLARWHAMAPRERAGLGMAGAVLGLAFVWWVLIAPALQTLRVADQQRQALGQQMQTLRGLQAQAKALQGSAKISTSDAVQALEASIKQQLGTTAQMNVVGERASITLKGANPDAVAKWLAQARVNAHALPTEAHLQRSADLANPKWDGTVVLRLP